MGAPLCAGWPFAMHDFRVVKLIDNVVPSWKPMIAERQLGDVATLMELFDVS
jgi:hypothetical protein